MEVYCFLLCCMLFTSVACLSISDIFSKYDNESLLEVARGNRCKCSNGRCVTDNRGNTKCVCKPGYALQDEFTCKQCDCGSKGKCIFTLHPKSRGGFSYEKKCICDVGSAEKDGRCIDCYCGENSACEFHGEEKNCYCIEGYSEKDGACTRCDCGFYGKCEFVGGIKKCECDDGHLELDGRCEECDCGENAVKCTPFGGGYKKCDCKWKYAERYGKCEECDCGGQGMCSFMDGAKYCHCQEGYRENAGICKKCHCGANSVDCRFSRGVKECECKTNFADRAGTCEACDCGPYSSNCSFKNYEKKCQCTEGYVQKGSLCEVGCSYQNPCRNGGFCQQGFCSCLLGTSGEFCEVIDECDILCPKQRDVKCSYDINRKKPVCECLENFLRFDPETKQCRNSCEGNRGCQNGGICSHSDDGYSEFCRCLEGTTGDFCENITECDYKQCGPDARCAYNVGQKRAVCYCMDTSLLFDEVTVKCKRTCSDDSGCGNGGRCVDGFCDCLEGTAGDLCESVPECDSMNCGRGARCVYDAYRRSAVCSCNDQNLSFDGKDLACKRTCSDDSGCGNGGRCVDGFCDCLEGTAGDLCESVPGCDSMICGRGARCVYDAYGRSAVCSCNDQNLSFDGKDLTCKRTCSDDSGCGNGGRCVDGFCDCLEGTAGDLCENVPECESMNCGRDARCVYDAYRRSVVCSCNDQNLSFDGKDLACKKTCNDDLGCGNGGRCVERFCDCLDGTLGDLCESIPDCSNKDCGQDAICVYNVEKRSAVCACDGERYSFDEADRTCKRGCTVDEECLNGGTCISRGFNTFCDCLPGTQGDVCETVDDCKEDRIRCKGDAFCAFDAQKRKAVCECSHLDERYDVLTDECKPICHEDATCHNGGLCMPRGDHLFCECKVGTSGDLCEVIDDCWKGLCGFSSEVECQYNVTTEAAECRCRNEVHGFDQSTMTCKDCDCGRNSFFCRFENGRKVCGCRDGYVVRNGTCQKASCTEKRCHNGKCRVVGEEEVCSCFEGYELEGGDYCRKLNCSRTPCFNGTCVVRQGNREECVCQAGYTLKDGSCIRGACKVTTCFGGTCKMVDDELMCVCPKNYSLQGIGCFATVCKKYHCFGGWCVVNENKEEICTCHEGYILVNDVCKKILCTKPCFGGECKFVDGREECICPPGYSIFEGVCRATPK